MNSTNKKTAGVRSIPQPANRPAGHVTQSKPVVAQSKTIVQAKMSVALPKRPVAPPAYRPQAVPKVLQTKQTVSSQARQGVVQLWRQVAGQDGEFEGDPAYHHLHRAGGTEHYKYGNNQRSRINYMNGAVIHYDNIERAIERCEGHQNATGRVEVLAELRRLLAARPAPAPVPAAVVPAVPAAGVPAGPPAAPPAENKEVKRVNKQRAHINAQGDKLLARKEPWE